MFAGFDIMFTRPVQKKRRYGKFYDPFRAVGSRIVNINSLVGLFFLVKRLIEKYFSLYLAVSKREGDTKEI